MRKTIIGISGRRESGKSTACSFLTRRSASIWREPVHCARFPFAGPLKKLCEEVLGVPHAHLWGTDLEKKSPTPYCWQYLPHHAEACLDRLAARVDLERVPCAELRRLVPSHGRGEEGSCGGYCHDKALDAVADDVLDWGLMTARQLMQQVGTMFRMMDEDVWVKACLRSIRNSPTEVCLVDDVRYVNEVAALQAAGGVVFRLLRSPHPDDPHASETELDGHDGFDFVLDNRDRPAAWTHGAVWAGLAEKGLCPIPSPADLLAADAMEAP